MAAALVHQGTETGLSSGGPKCYIMNLSFCGASGGLDASCNPAAAQIESGCLQTPTPCRTHPGPHPGLTHTNPIHNLKQV